MNARKCIVSGVLVVSFVSALLSFQNVAAKDSEKSVANSSYSNCVNPGQFWNSSDISIQQYKQIYLGVCARVGDGKSNSLANESNNNSSGKSISVTKTPVVESTKVPQITKTPKPENTPVPTKEIKPTKVPQNTPVPTDEPTCSTKNKNDNKKPNENPCDGNAGIGNG